MRLLATLLFPVILGSLFWRDIKRQRQAISLIPLLWMFLAGSRWVSSWLSLSSPVVTADAYAEGSPVDRMVFFALIVSGIVVLIRRRNLRWDRLIANNWLIVSYLLYCLISMLWSDEPFILVRRWIKDLGNPIMALVMLTEMYPYEAIRTTLRRLSYLLLSLSMLFIRYFPQLGRGYRDDGTMMFTGAGHQKNDLGSMCLFAGIYFFWVLLRKRKENDSSERFDLVAVAFVALLLYLLRLSDSQTSVACLAVSIGILLVARARPIALKPSRLVATLAVAAIAYVALDSTLHIQDLALGLMGRDASFTKRTDLWALIRPHEKNALIGTGFMTFWTGDRMESIWRSLGAVVNQAHNGYLEQYLNLGYIGVGFIVAIMLSALVKIRKGLKTEPADNVFRLCLLVTAVLYNYTEASFYGINNMWVLLLAASMDVTGVARAPQEVVARSRMLFGRDLLLAARRFAVDQGPLATGRRWRYADAYKAARGPSVASPQVVTPRPHMPAIGAFSSRRSKPRRPSAASRRLL